jgi:hypothetical protein
VHACETRQEMPAVHTHTVHQHAAQQRQRHISATLRTILCSDGAATAA